MGSTWLARRAQTGRYDNAFGRAGENDTRPLAVPCAWLASLVGALLWLGRKSKMAATFGRGAFTLPVEIFGRTSLPPTKVNDEAL